MKKILSLSGLPGAGQSSSDSTLIPITFMLERGGRHFEDYPVVPGEVCRSVGRGVEVLTTLRSGKNVLATSFDPDTNPDDGFARGLLESFSGAPHLAEAIRSVCLVEVAYKTETTDEMKIQLVAYSVAGVPILVVDHTERPGYQNTLVTILAHTSTKEPGTGGYN